LNAGWSSEEKAVRLSVGLSVCQTHAFWAGVSVWESGERGSQTVGGAEAGLFESLPGSLYSLLADTDGVVRTLVMGKS